MNDVAATFAMGIDAAIAPRPACSTELVSGDLPVFHWEYWGAFPAWGVSES